MQILAIEKELAPLDAQRDRDVLREEAARAWALQKAGVIRQIWFTLADHRAVILLECSTEAEALEHLHSLPLVRERFIDFDLFSLRAYDGFDRLISDRHP